MFEATRQASLLVRRLVKLRRTSSQVDVGHWLGVGVFDNETCIAFDSAPWTWKPSGLCRFHREHHKITPQFTHPLQIIHKRTARGGVGRVGLP